MMTFRTKDSMSIHVMLWLTLQARIADTNMNLDLVMLSVVMLSVVAPFILHVFVCIDLKRITRCKLALIFTSADHKIFLGLFGSEAVRL